MTTPFDLNAAVHSLAQNNALQGNIILVTGAGRGIGQAAAMAFAEQGATVILLGKNVERLESVYDDIVAKQLPEPVILPVDLLTMSDSDAETFAEAIQEQFGRLDGLVHNAGMLGQKAPIDTYHTTTFEQTLHLNVTAAFILTKAMLPLLNQAKNGRILFTSSSVGKQGRAFWGAYSVSKFAVEGLMQTLADELENTSQIRVNAINPGATRTDMRAQAYPGENPNQLKSAEQLMPHYVYLLSAQSQHLHGHSFDFQLLTH